MSVHEVYIKFPGRNYVCRNCGEEQTDIEGFSAACFYPKFVALVGEHDKGTGEAFHKSTLSGRRIRAMIDEIDLVCTLENAFLYPSLLPRKLDRLHSAHLVVALGKRALAELNRQGIKCQYLPHPACRSKKQLDELRAGLRAVADEQRRTTRHKSGRDEAETVQ